jgi:hypothetical protein
MGLSRLPRIVDIQRMTVILANRNQTRRLVGGLVAFTIGVWFIWPPPMIAAMACIIIGIASAIILLVDRNETWPKYVSVAFWLVGTMWVRSSLGDTSRQFAGALPLILIGFSSRLATMLATSYWIRRNIPSVRAK